MNAAVPRLVDALPNGPQHFATVHVFLAGGVPEVMLQLAGTGALRLDARTVTGRTLGRRPGVVGDLRPAPPRSATAWPRSTASIPTTSSARSIGVCPAP